MWKRLLTFSLLLAGTAAWAVGPTFNATTRPPAPNNATYITQTANGELTNEQALSSLSSGIMRVETGTGAITALTTSAGIAANISDETGSGALVFGTSPTITTSLSQDGDVADAGYLRLQNASLIGWEASPAGTDVTLGVNSSEVLVSSGNFSAPVFSSAAADPADAGVIRLGNAEVIGWEASPASTDITLSVDSGEILQCSGAFNAITLTENANAVPNSTDNLSFFAATTSAQLAGVLSDETGTGSAVFGSSPTIVTPTIASFTNAQHNHTNAAGGGQLTDAALSGAVGVTKGGTGTTTQFTQGSVVFAGASGVYTQDNSNLFWDDTANYLGIGTAPSGNSLGLHLSNDGQVGTMWSDSTGTADDKNARVIYDGGGAVTGGSWVWQSFSDAFAFQNNLMALNQSTGRLTIGGGNLLGEGMIHIGGAGATRDGDWHSALEINVGASNAPAIIFGDTDADDFAGIVATTSSTGNTTTSIVGEMAFNRYNDGTDQGYWYVSANPNIGTTGPTVLLEADNYGFKTNTGLKVKRTTVADANKTALYSEYIIAYTSITTTRTVTLPATSEAGRLYIIKDESGSVTDLINIIVDGDSSDTIDGQASISINVPYGVVKIYSDGTNWFTL